MQGSGLFSTFAISNIAASDAAAVTAAIRPANEPTKKRGGLILSNSHRRFSLSHSPDDALI